MVNRCLETYLRCMCSDNPKQWSKWLPLAEWWYNTTYHNLIKANPYEIVYGQALPTYLPYLPSESKVELVDRSLEKREETLLKKSHFTTRYPHRSRHTRRSRSSGGNSVNMLPFYVPCAWRVTHSTRLTGVPVFEGCAAGKLRRCF